MLSLSVWKFFKLEKYELCVRSPNCVFGVQTVCLAKEREKVIDRKAPENRGKNPKTE